MSATEAAETRRTYPLMERPVVGASLAGIAGLLNGWTLAHTQSFASVQSGNVITAALSLVHGDRGSVAMATASIAAFALGAGVCEIGKASFAAGSRSYSPWVLAAETALLAGLAGLAAIPALDAWWIAIGISAIAGAQANAFHRDRGMVYGNVAVTAVLQLAAGHVGRAVVPWSSTPPRSHLKAAGIYLSVLLAFGGGAAIGVAVDRAWAPGAVVIAAVVAGILAIVSATAGEHVDPGPDVMPV